MKIVSLVTGPVYRNQIHGGSYRILWEVLKGLVDSGHEVTLICGRGPVNHETYEIDQIKVKPFLPLKRLFPFPFAISFHDMSKVMEILYQEIKGADVVYNHDSQFLWCLGSLIGNHQRLTCSIRDFIYAESLQGIYCLQKADCVIANSQYAFNVLSYLNQHHKLGIEHSLVCIENGIDLEFWLRDCSKSTIDQFVMLPQGAKLLICPVRPELNKGIFEALQVLKEVLVREIDAHLVICKYVDEGFPALEEYRAALAKWKQNNHAIVDRIHIIPWLDSESLRCLYKRADVTLCLGVFPEAFGSNVYAESVAAGTPCVASMAGAMRTTFSAQLAFMVPPFDINGAVEKVRHILSMSSTELENWRNNVKAVLRNRYSFKRMREDYMCAITGHESIIQTSQTPYRVMKSPPWQFVTPGGRTYDDFFQRYIDNA